MTPSTTGALPDPPPDPLLALLKGEGAKGVRAGDAPAPADVAERKERSEGDAAAGEDREPELLTPEQAARVLSLSGRTLSRLTARGEVPYLRLGKRLVRYPRRALREWVEARTCRGKGRRS